MALKNLFKLEKLKIEAYTDSARSQSAGAFEAMFNPTSFHQKYDIQYSKTPGLNSSGAELKYTFSKPNDLSVKLILDGTGVHEMGILQLGRQQTVSERVKQFLDLAYQMDGKIHEPHYLKVKWGDLRFNCRLGSVTVTYTSFDRAGKALRAELDVILISDEDPKVLVLQARKSSPDLTHSRIVRSGDTLPLLSKEVYGDSSYYLRVAQFNNLDNFRNLRAGQEIFFPPLAQ